MRIKEVFDWEDLGLRMEKMGRRIDEGYVSRARWEEGRFRRDEMGSRRIKEGLVWKTED